MCVGACGVRIGVWGLFMCRCGMDGGAYVLVIGAAVVVVGAGVVVVGAAVVVVGAAVVVVGAAVVVVGAAVSEVAPQEASKAKEIRR